MYSGFLNILKPPGMSSHDVVSFIRRIYQTKKVGHAGTLDPGAAGVLPIAIGKATRLIEYMADENKSYRAELTFGYSTDSGDEHGALLYKTTNFAIPSINEFNAILKFFLGEIKQIPPMHSAIKINGTKLYELARKGIVADIPERIIRINALTFQHKDKDKFIFDIDCSKGTYIRSLCIDIGKKFDIPAIMSFLIRTRVGSFSIENAITLEKISKDPAKYILDIDSVLNKLPAVYLNINQTIDFKHGKIVLFNSSNKIAQTVKVYDSTPAFIGIASVDTNNHLVPHKVITS